MLYVFCSMHVGGINILYNAYQFGEVMRHITTNCASNSVHLRRPKHASKRKWKMRKTCFFGSFLGCFMFLSHLQDNQFLLPCLLE